LIRERAARGELTYLSLAPVAGKGDNGVVYSATYSPASQWGHGFGRDPDPVEAIKKALADMKLSKMVKRLTEKNPEAKAVAESVEKEPEPWDV
jgi:hypothetical protein